MHAPLPVHFTALTAIYAQKKPHTHTLSLSRIRTHITDHAGVHYLCQVLSYERQLLPPAEYASVTAKLQIWLRDILQFYAGHETLWSLWRWVMVQQLSQQHIDGAKRCRYNISVPHFSVHSYI